MIHVNVWQNPLQYCKVTSLQLKYINFEKKKERNQPDGCSLVCCHFSLVAFNILSLSLIFVSLITMCLSVFLLGISCLVLCTSWTWLTVFLFHVGKVFSCYLFKYFLGSFLSLSLCPSGTPIMRILGWLMLSQRPLSLSSFLFILFSIFCFAA